MKPVYYPLIWLPESITELERIAQNSVSSVEDYFERSEFHC